MTTESLQQLGMSWEPLPPRLVSHRRRSSRRHTAHLAVFKASKEKHQEEHALHHSNSGTSAQKLVKEELVKDELSVAANTEHIVVANAQSTEPPTAVQTVTSVAPVKVQTSSNGPQTSSCFAQSPLPEPKRANRPGFNSYLKVVLDDAAMDQLHQLALQVRKQIDEQWSQSQKNVEVTSTTKDEDQQPRHDSAGQSYSEQGDQQGRGGRNRRQRGQPQPFRLKTRSRESLHMTLFFGGETLCDLPPGELIEWHGRVRDRLQESEFFPRPSNADETTAAKTAQVEDKEEDVDNTDQPMASPNDYDIAQKYWFRVVNICVFPPQRRNLVVAILEASPAWHSIHDDIRSLASNQHNCWSPALAEITKASKAKWTPHITLGNLFGGSRADISTLSQLLRNYEASELSSDLAQPPNDADGALPLPFTAIAKGISMGGPIPTQAALDWEFVQVCKRDKE